jgi:hypothetical protein
MDEKILNFITDLKLDFFLGNAVKHISTASNKRKNAKIEDLKTAIWYLEQRISQLKAQNKE